jgi:hypothetical protein
MKVTRDETVTITMSGSDALRLAEAIADAMSGLSEQKWNGFCYNWRADGRNLTKLYNALKPADWGTMQE